MFLSSGNFIFCADKIEGETILVDKTIFRVDAEDRRSLNCIYHFFFFNGFGLGVIVFFLISLGIVSVAIVRCSLE